VVFGVGNPEATLMFVGEAPGADEDKLGEPFVGAAGKLLTKMIEAMGIKRSDVYIANVLKCRPDMPAGSPGNRPPSAAEMATCLPYLQRQIRIITPKAIVALGSTAVQGLFGLREIKLGQLRGKWKELGVPDQCETPLTIPVMVTYHPAYLLRNQSVSEKRKVWEDLLAVLEKLEMPISEKQRRFFTAGTG
jgi:DNA polymerase